MEWVLIFSIQWTVAGTPLPPTTTVDSGYASKELCEAALSALAEKFNLPYSEAVETRARMVCVQRK